MPAVRNQILKDPYPADVVWKGKAVVLEGRDLVTELVWLASIFSQTTNEIRDFVSHEREFSERYIRNDFERAQNAIDELKEKYGYSRWLIRQQINLFARSNLSDEKIKFVDRIVEDSDGGLFGFAAYFHTLRIDPDISSAWVDAQIDRFFSSVKNTDFVLYARWLMSSDDIEIVSQIPSLMSFDELSPLFDRYVTFRSAVQRLACEPDTLDPVLLALIEGIATVVDDAALSQALHIILGARALPTFNPADELRAYDSYTAGDYSSAASLANQHLSDDPSRSALIELGARAEARLPEAESKMGDYLWHEIMSDMITIYRRTDDLDDARVRLQRTAEGRAFPPYTKSIRAFLARETSHSPNVLGSIYDALLSSSLSNSSPHHWRCLCQLRRDVTLFTAAETAHPDSLAVALQSALMGADLRALESIESSLPASRFRRYRALIALARNDSGAAIADFKSELESEFTADRVSAAQGIAQAYERAADPIGALDVVAQTVSEVPSAWRQFDIADLIERTEKGSLTKAYARLSLPLLYDVYSRHISSDRDAQKADAAEEFVLSLGVDRPSEIDPDCVHDKRGFKIFLQNVCTQRTLDPFLWVNDASDVELERIAICQRLTEIAPENASVYADEIREITRRRIVRARLKQVEKSKIFVDVSNVKRKAEKQLREQFVRFQELLSRPDYDRSFMKLINNVREIVGETETLIHISDLPTDEREQSFRKLCSEVFSLLLTSQEHGFKTYLSTRIKHGTLAAQISSPFATNHLLLEVNDGNYVRSYHWDEQLYLSYVESAKLHSAIERFSRSVNDIIYKLKNSYIQIKNDDHKEAWLDFAFFRTQILFLQAQVSETTSFDEFFDIVLDRFWKALDGNLAIVRNKLNLLTKVELANELDRLEAEVQDALPNVEVITPILSAIAAARTEAQNSLDVIIGWFRLTQSVERPDYDFEIAVDVALESINSCFKSRPISLSRELRVKRDLKGSTLESVVDILFILFENAITHAQGGGGSDVLIRAEAGNDILLLEVENPVSDSTASLIDNEALRERLEELRLDTAQTMVSREGGSGFAKILKILRHDLTAENAVTAQIVDNRRFRVGINIESQGLFV